MTKDHGEFDPAAFQIITVEGTRDALIASFVGPRVHSDAEIQQAGAELLSVLDVAASIDMPLVVNFGRVEYISSALIGKLVLVNRKAKAHGVALRMADISPLVAEVFRRIRPGDGPVETHDDPYQPPARPTKEAKLDGVKMGDNIWARRLINWIICSHSLSIACCLLIVLKEILSRESPHGLYVMLSVMNPILQLLAQPPLCICPLVMLGVVSLGRLTLRTRLFGILAETALALVHLVILLPLVQ
jgi:anti-sigma B factor antagonist